MEDRKAKNALSGVKRRRTQLIRTLKAQGIYSDEMYMQVTLAAQLMVRAEQLFAEIMSEGHEAILTMTSREGNTRQKVSPLEPLYLDYVDRAQRAIKALGSNTDSKVKKDDDTDTYGSFMEAMNSED